jgi:glutamate-1-semialdehyde 2,1-aminomutase
MDTVTALLAAGLLASAASVRPVRARLQLSRAKHPSLQGHSRLARWLARRVPYYEFRDERFYGSDDAPPDVQARRRSGFERLATVLQERAPRTIQLTEALEPSLSDLQFTKAYRVPFQYRAYVNRHLKIGAILEESSGVLVKDADGNSAYDLAGSYGVNVFGADFYKECVDAGIERVRDLGPLLGSYHPVIEENVRKLKDISGLDEVSFHMSGTEAVMQAVRLARYHTGRSHLVRFCGAYHGWWDDVQPGVGTPRTVRDVYTLRDVDERTLRVLRGRRDIACVLVNPVQSLHPNAAAPSDASLINGERRAHFDRTSYSRWLQDLRRVCSEQSIVLILDEVLVGFRLAYRGAQEYFGVAADMVTYGKTLGGGLPVGVLCGKRQIMKRFRDDRPSDICFARGTFNSHPYVMGVMNEFLRRLGDPTIRRSYQLVSTVWDARAADLNARLADGDLPVRVANLASIWTVCYLAPSRYNWMFQYYLRAEGLALSWVGSGRLIFSHNYSDAEFDEVADRFVAAAHAMRGDGWWWTTTAVTNLAIKRQVLGELVAARVPGLGRRLMRPDRPRSGRATPPAEPGSAPGSTAARHETGR